MFPFIFIILQLQFVLSWSSYTATGKIGSPWAENSTMIYIFHLRNENLRTEEIPTV